MPDRAKLMTEALAGASAAVTTAILMERMRIGPRIEAAGEERGAGRAARPAARAAEGVAGYLVFRGVMELTRRLGPSRPKPA